MLVDIDLFGDSIGRAPWDEDSADFRRASYALDSAEGIVLDNVNRTTEWLTPEDIPRTVRTVIFELAGRKFANPKGLLSRGVGPLSESMSPEAAAGLALSDSEKEQLNPFRASRGGLQSVEIKRADTVGKDTLYFSDGQSGSIMRIPFVDASESDFYPE